MKKKAEQGAGDRFSGTGQLFSAGVFRGDLPKEAILNTYLKEVGEPHEGPGTFQAKGRAGVGRR